MVSLFQHIYHFFMMKMLDSKDYTIVIKCRTERAQVLLEQQILREFNDMAQFRLDGERCARANKGTCHGIDFELTT